MNDLRRSEVSAAERQRCVHAGWIAGWIGGFGMGGFWWMNPYIALSLLLGSVVLGAVALVGALHGGFDYEKGEQ